jgi:hypothetical protein
MSTDTRLKKLEASPLSQLADKTNDVRVICLYGKILDAIENGTEDDPYLDDVVAELSELLPGEDCSVANVKAINLKLETEY